MSECQSCGVLNLDGAQYCQDCGAELEKYPTKYQNLSLLGVAGLFVGIMYPLFLLLTVGIGVYMWTRPEEFAKKRGKFLILFSVIIFLVALAINIII